MCDDFAEETKRNLAAQQATHARTQTAALRLVGREHIPKTLNIGVAGHITAAAPGGPRYDPR